MENGKEIIVNFQFLNEKKDKILIVDAPFLMLSCLDLHQSKMKELQRFTQTGLDLKSLGYYYPLEQAVFTETLNYFLDIGGYQKENIQIQRF